MKRVVIATLSFILTAGCFAQDLIVKKDGSVIQAKIAKIGTAEVEYKKWSSQDGPMYAIAKSDILAITYQNGEKETFSDVAPTQATQTPASQDGPIQIERPAAANNAELIARYNKNITLKKPGKIGKAVPSAVGIFAFSENSILSNDDIEIYFSLCKNPTPSPYFKPDAHLLYRFNIIVKNKTDQTLYIDLANCSRTNTRTADSKTYYTGETVSISHGSTTGMGLGIGGILPGVGIGLGVGVSSTGSATRTFSQERILNIPPHSAKVMAEFKLAKVKSDKCELVSKGEEFAFGVKNIAGFPDFGETQYQQSGLSVGTISSNEIIDYTIDNSPIIYDYRFVYSSIADFSNYSVLSAHLYMKQLIGLTKKNVGLTYSWLKNTRYSKLLVDDLEGYDENTICGPIRFEK